MVRASRTFRVFVSSTFDDLKAERNALQEAVFPRLRDLCAAHGTRFQAIDLRWGVSEEAGRDQQTMAICLDEVRRCQDSSPRPNFIVLLGDRYGWCPLPSSIAATEFEEITANLPDEDRALLDFDEAGPGELNGWYRRDDNAVPPAYRLRERRVTVPDGASEEQKQAAHDAESTAWRDVEARLREILRRAIDSLGWATGDARRVKYETSATEQEILRGALCVADARDHVLGFVREIENLDDLARSIPAEPAVAEAGPDLPQAEKLVDLTSDRVRDEGARQRLDALKRRLDAHLGPNVRRYGARWEGDRVSGGHLDQLCADVHGALAAVIAAEIGRIEAEPELEKEIEDHRVFGEERAGARFVGRLEPLAAIRTYIAAGDDHPLTVVGASGSGKSALMAAAARDAGEDAAVVRFIGATPGSSIGRSLLVGLCRQVARRYEDDGLTDAAGEGGERHGPRSESDIPTDYRELVAELPRQLARATARRRLVIFVDALDQLSSADGARDLAWLPRELPAHVRIVVSTSTSPADCLDALRAKLPAHSFVELEPMRRHEGEELLGSWLERAGRRLQPDQRDYVLDRFASANVGEGVGGEQGGLPLYLKLAFEEARRWRSHDGLPGLHPTIRGAIRDDLFARLSAETNHGRVLVRHALGYLGAAKNGLTEDEMLDVLSRDREVLEDFRRRSPRSPVVPRLPVAVWSRLYFDLEPYLTERSADGTTLLGFYHRQLADVVTEDFLGEPVQADAPPAAEGLARHEHLARFFALPEAEEATFTLRQMSELPYQQGCARMWDPLFETLTNFRFLEQKAATGAVEAAGDGAATTYAGVIALQDDFAFALERMPGGETDAGRRPIIVTATDVGKGAGVQVHCPFCDRYSDLREPWLGAEIRCPREGCGRRLRVNSFTVSR